MSALGNNVRYLDTATAYDLWSEVYDTDGNFLQALDTLEMKTLLPRLISQLKGPKPWKIVDLGCGTGRNTMALLHIAEIEITALDLSPKMLEIARQRLTTECINLGRSEPSFEVFDMLTSSTVPETAKNVHAVISTLVVEHVPLDNFFTTIAEMIRPGGLLLLTNMHSEMGKISQAGFVDPKTGEKIRPISYAHRIDEVIDVAARLGFEVVGQVEQRDINDDMASRLGKRASKWIGVSVWFGGIFCKSS